MGLLNTSNSNWQTPIEQGIQSYFDERDRADQKKIGLKEKGLIQNQDGGYDYDPETQAARQRASQMGDLQLQQEKNQTEQQPTQFKAGLLEKGVQQNPEGGVGWTADQIKRQAVEDRLKTAQANMYQAHAKEYLTGKTGENINKDVTGAQNYLGKDKNYGDAKKMMDLSDQAKDVIQSALTNPVAKNNIPTILSNIAGHGQRLHTSTMEQQKGDQSMIARFNQMVQSNAKGTLTPANAKEMLDFVDTMVSPTKRSVEQMELGQAKKFMQTHKKDSDGSPIDINKAYQYITGNPYQNNQSPQSQGLIQSPPNGLMGQKVKVSNGKESYFIDPSHLADATNDGFMQVK